MYTVTNYMILIGADGWGLIETVSEAEHDAAMGRMERYLTDHEGDDLCISVRAPYRGEAAGTYAVRAGGNLQILGYSIETPEVVHELVNTAWQHACETWDDETEV